MDTKADASVNRIFTPPPITEEEFVRFVAFSQRWDGMAPVPADIELVLCLALEFMEVHGHA